MERNAKTFAILHVTGEDRTQWRMAQFTATWASVMKWSEDFDQSLAAHERAGDGFIAAMNETLSKLLACLDADDYRSRKNIKLWGSQMFAITLMRDMSLRGEATVVKETREARFVTLRVSHNAAGTPELALVNISDEKIANRFGKFELPALDRLDVWHRPGYAATDLFAR